jgi:hypothetical protein
MPAYQEFLAQKTAIGLERLHRKLEKPESDRTLVLQQGRALASLVLANHTDLGINEEKARSFGRHGYLLNPEIELALEHHLILPFPNPSPVQFEETENLDEHILPSDRWGNTEDAKERIEYWLNRDETVGVLAGKFRLLNMGEVDALWKARKRVKHFIVAAASVGLCLVDKEYEESQFAPPLEWRMQQLIDLRFPDNSKIDYVYHNDADPFFLAGGESISFLPFYFFNLPTFQEQSDYLLDQSTQLEIISRRSSQLDVWEPLAEAHQPTPQQSKSLNNFSYMLTADPSVVENLERRARIFESFGGHVQWLDPHPYGKTISSTEIIKRWNLTPKDSLRWHFQRAEQADKEDLYNLARVRAISRASASSSK